jgi:hypothetical protein
VVSLGYARLEGGHARMDCGEERVFLVDKGCLARVVMHLDGAFPLRMQRLALSGQGPKALAEGGMFVMYRGMHP